MKRPHALALPVALLVSGRASAYAITTTSQGVPQRWEAPAVEVGIDPAAPSRTVDGRDVDAALAAALATWSALPEARVTLAPVTNSAPPAVLRFRSSGWPYSHEWLAYTLVSSHEFSGAIAAAEIDFNEEDFAFSTESTEGGRYDLQAVLTHEVGHLLGLGHSKDDHATMFAGTSPGERSQREPDTDDRAGLAALYDQAPAGGCQLAGAGSSSSSPLSCFGALLALAAALFRRRPL